MCLVVRVLLPSAMALSKREQLLALHQRDPDVIYAHAERACNVSFETAKLWIDRFRAGDISLQSKHRSGRDKKLSSIECKAIKRHMRTKNAATVGTATRMVNNNRAPDNQVSEATVRRAKDTLVFKLRQHKAISAKNSVLRGKATSRRKVAAVRKQLRFTCFTDASYVRFAPRRFVQPHRFEHGWELEGTPAREYDATKYKLVGFYAGIISPRKGVVKHTPLIFVAPTPGCGESLDTRCYCRDVVPVFDKWGQEELGEDLQYWLQDNAPPHKTKTTLRAFARRGMQLVDHVAQSPDMNPIEKCWAVFKLLIAQRRPYTWEGLFKAMQEEWHHAVEKIGEKAIMSLPQVMELIHESPGVHVKQLPSSL